MHARNEFLLVFAVALMFCVILTTAIVRAIPPDPTEGDLEDTKEVGGSGWYVKAYVWGHWIYVPGTPSYYAFEEEYWPGSRYASSGVFTEGDLKFWWDYNISNRTESENIDVIDHHLYVNCHYVFGKSYSKFYNWYGQHWEAYTEWAEIRI